MTSPRKLTRSSTDRKLAGVAGGLAEYFSVDPVIFRVAFVVLALTTGIGLLAYLGFLLVVPRDDEAPAAWPPASPAAA